MARMGRPTKFTSETLKTVQKYIIDYEGYGDAMPSVAGLAVVLNVGRSRIYDWENRDDHPDFRDMLEKLLATQEQVLFNKGLTSDFNPTLTKLALTKHGYSDRNELTVDERPLVTRKRFDGSE